MEDYPRFLVDQIYSHGFLKAENLSWLWQEGDVTMEGWTEGANTTGL